MSLRGYLCWMLGHLRSRERAWNDEQGRWRSVCVHCETDLERCRDRKWRPLSAGD